MAKKSQKTKAMASFSKAEHLRSASHRCCGNCVYYMPYENKCGRDRFKRISGAADGCGLFRIK